MANTIITPSVIAKRAQAILWQSTILAQMVDRDFEAEFGGKQGDTITVRTKPKFEVKEFDPANGTVVQDITEGSFPLKLDKHLDITFAVSSKDMTLSVDDFSERFLQSALEAYAQDLDQRVAEVLATTARGAGGGGVATVTGGKPRTVLGRAATVIGRANFPTNERYAVFSHEGAEVMGSDDVIERADASGSTNALREASLGRLKGFDTYTSGAFGYGPGNRGKADGVAFHRSAVMLATRTLEKPLDTGQRCEVVNYKGFGLRVVYGYDMKFKSNIVSIDMLAGVGKVPNREKGVVELDLSQGS
ncbi:MAG: hypothetical protein PGN13_16290 [Patulibacter minatonensis]